MGNYYILVNRSRDEFIRFIGYSKQYELIGNKITAQMVAYYLFEHNGDYVFYVGDEWNVGFVHENFDKIIENYEDVTLETLEGMIEDQFFNEEDLDRFSSRWRGTNQKVKP
jgi:hypothetical protein